MRNVFSEPLGRIVEGLRAIESKAVGEPGVPTEAQPFGKYHYLLCPLPMTWPEAKRYCEARGAYLAEISTPDEEHFIKSFGFSLLWVGFSLNQGERAKWSKTGDEVKIKWKDFASLVLSEY